MKRLAQEWEEFRKILPPSMTEGQVKIIRRTFYAGMIALYSVLAKQVGPNQKEEPTEDDLKMMDEIQQEFMEFHKEIEAQASEAFKRILQRQAGRN